MPGIEEVRERQEALVKRLRADYEQTIVSDMVHLYNQMVSFMSVSKAPLPHICVVLDLLKEEALEQVKATYKKV